MDSPISLLVEIPEALHYSLGSFLESRPDWDQDRVFSAAISLFLLQSRTPEQDEARSADHRQTARIYLDTLFRKPTGAELIP
jgi:predicted dienelactone hydrolase